MTGSESRTILIVEDEAAIRDMLSFTLHRGGYAVIEAADTREAMEQLGYKPDLVLLDWMLPGISGVEFARRLRQEEATRSLPVIM
ncbi:MAG: response regulator, partial [Gammaproteobacteria bacterium]|nr:response regulator [Gammaproteobacteria bacterium]